MVDLFKPVGPDENGEAPSPAKRLLWFVGLAIASGTIVAITAYALRGLLFI